MVLLLLSSFALHAQQVSASLDTNHYQIGEWIPLQLQAVIPSDANISWPPIDDELEGLEVLNRTELDSVYTDASKEYRQTLTLTVFDSGYYPVPAFDFVINGDTISTEAMLIRIHSVPLDTTMLDIKPIKGPIDAPITLKELLPYILGGLGLIILLIILAVYLATRKKKKPLEKAVPKVVIPPHILALEQLDELQKEQLWQRGEVKLYYIKLTDILRQYIELRYKQPAMESTTDEIMDRLLLLSLPQPLLEKTKTTLVLSDFVKFAKAKPLSNEHEQSFAAVIDFVNATKQATEITSGT